MNAHDGWLNKEYVVIVECVDGNETIGKTWYETKVFEPCDSLEDVMKWANNIKVATGKVILTVGN